MKIALCFLLALCSMAFAADCYFQTRRISYDSKTSVRKIGCDAARNAVRDVDFYDGMDNYARYYGRRFGREGNLILEKDDGTILIAKFYYAQGEYRLYGSIEYYGANVVNCFTTTSSGYCDNVEYTDFGLYLNDFLGSPARRNR